MLRGELHPNFISWSICNVNRPLLVLIRVLNTFMLLAAIGLSVLFMIMDWPKPLRAVTGPLWVMGFCGLIASASGMCMFLHFKNRKQLRPWEQPTDIETESFRRSKRHLRKNTADSVMSFVDPLRKESLQTFGPRNDFSEEDWVATYDKKSWVSKIFDPTVPIENRHVIVLQDGVIAGSILWGTLLGVAVTAGLVFLPSLKEILR